MDGAKLIQFKQFIEQCKSNPSILSDPSLSFFRDYLESLDAKLSQFAYKPGEQKSDPELMSAFKDPEVMVALQDGPFSDALKFLSYLKDWSSNPDKVMITMVGIYVDLTYSYLSVMKVMIAMVGIYVDLTYSYLSVMKVKRNP